MRKERIRVIRLFASTGRRNTPASHSARGFPAVSFASTGAPMERDADVSPFR
jgi:hypothetical protein